MLLCLLPGSRSVFKSRSVFRFTGFHRCTVDGPKWSSGQFKCLVVGLSFFPVHTEYTQMQLTPAKVAFFYRFEATSLKMPSKVQAVVSISAYLQDSGLKWSCESWSRLFRCFLFHLKVRQISFYKSFYLLSCPADHLPNTSVSLFPPNFLAVSEPWVTQHPSVLCNQ